MDAREFESPKPLTTAVLTLAVFIAVLYLVSIGLDIYFSMLVSGAIAHDATSVPGMVAHVHDLTVMQALLQLLVLVLFVTDTILFCMWIYRTASNNLALGAQGQEFTPGWAVGYMFIPVANLFMTYRSVLEVWSTSHDPSGQAAAPRPLPVLWWWITYLFSGLILYIASQVAGEPPRTFPDILHGNIMDIVGLAIRLVAAVLFMVIVWKVSRLQSMHGQRQAGELPARDMSSEVAV